MNENVEKLRALKEDLDKTEQEHPEILGKEHDIARYLHAAADEARRRLKQVEGT